MIVQVIAQQRKDETEVLLFDESGMVEMLLFDTIQLTNGTFELEDGNAPSNVTLKGSSRIMADQLVQCVKCNKYIPTILAHGEPDEKRCIKGCD